MKSFPYEPNPNPNYVPPALKKAENIKVQCEYCGRSNDFAEETCKSCGAILEKSSKNTDYSNQIVIENEIKIQMLKRELDAIQFNMVLDNQAMQIQQALKEIKPQCYTPKVNLPIITIFFAIISWAIFGEMLI